jgi:hypothetical protein
MQGRHHQYSHPYPSLAAQPIDCPHAMHAA